MITIKSLLDTLQLSREAALLGSYPSAILLYEMLLSSLNEFAKQDLEWQQLKDNIAKEFEVVKALNAEIDAFKEVSGNSLNAAVYDKDVWYVYCTSCSYC
jgi:hypothetical protein